MAHILVRGACVEVPQSLLSKPEGVSDPSKKIKIGFVGTGTITVAVVTGLCSAADASDLQITISPRNQEKAADLCTRFPLQVTVARNNQEVLDTSDIVCIAIIPAQAQDLLSGLRFRAEQHVVSFMSTVRLAQLAPLVAPAAALARAIPMPPMARRRGPCALFPAGAAVAPVLRRAATVVELSSEDELAVLMSTSATMAEFYQQLEATSAWMAARGVPARAAASYVGALFSALAADAADAAGDGGPAPVEGEGGFAGLVRESQTPGGLNEQALRELTGRGFYGMLTDELDVILARVRGGGAATAEPKE